MAIRSAFVALLVLATCPPDDPLARKVPSHLADSKAVRERLGLSPAYDGVLGVESVKVAVLDYGFDGLAEGKGYLPESAEIVEDYDPEFVRRFGLGDPEYRKPFEPLNRHGREMAQIVWSVAGSRPGGPKFYLLNANGPTMLRRAVRYAIEKRVDVILFSGSFEGGGSGDGKGPIDRVVDEAVARGILWVNAVGQLRRPGLQRPGSHPARRLPQAPQRVRHRRPPVPQPGRREHHHRHPDLERLQGRGRRRHRQGPRPLRRGLDRPVGSARARRCRSRATGSPAPEETRNPRERVVLADLPKNPHVPTDPDFCYRIRVQARRGRFSSGDRIRILLTPSRDTYVPAGRPRARGGRDLRRRQQRG